MTAHINPKLVRVKRGRRRSAASRKQPAPFNAAELQTQLAAVRTDPYRGASEENQ